MNRPPSPELLLEHIHWMRRLARSLVRDEAAVNDVVQQTLLTAIERPPRDREAATSWLKQVLRNLARRHGRTDARRRSRERAAARRIDSSPVASEVLERAELQRELVGLVFELEEPYRTMVLLRFFEEMSPREIAELHEVDASTVRRWLRHALKVLRHRLDARHGGERRAWVALLAPLALVPRITSAEVSGLEASMAAPASSAGLGVTASALAGGIAMSLKKTMIVVLTAVVLAAGLGGYLWTPRDEGTDESRSALVRRPPAVRPEEPVETSTDAAETAVVASIEEESPEPAEAVDSEGTGSIRGLARDHEGALLSGVHVRAYRITKPHVFWEETELEGDTRTAADGAFELAGLPVGTYNLCAISGEHRPFDVRDLELTAGDVLEITVELQAGLAITGTVVDPLGVAVAGAEVTSTAAPSHQGFPEILTPRNDIAGWAFRELTVTTDDEGRFRLTRLPSGNRRLVARHPDWATTDSNIASGSENVTITMRPGARLEGRVVDVSGAPVPHARVHVERWLERVWHESYKTGEDTTSDEDGLFDFDHLAPGRLQLGVDADDFPPFVTGEIVVRDGETPSSVELVLAAPARVSGILVDADGQPVAGANVLASKVQKVSGSRDSETTTETDGRFVLSPLEVGTKYSIQVQHPAFVSRRLDPITVQRETDLGDVTLEPGLVLTGEVVDPTGSLVAGAELVLERREGERWKVRSGRQMSVDGVFELRLLEDGEYRVNVSARGFAAAVSESALVAEGKESSIRVVLGGGTSARGRVVDDQGRPVRGAEVKLWQGRSEVRTVSDPDGRFVIHGLEAGEVRVEAGFGRWTSANYQPADTNDAIEIVIHRPARISGVVRDRATHQVVPDFRVFLATRPGRSSGGGAHFKSPLGGFVLDDLGPGSHRLRVLAPGYVLGETPIELAAGESRTIEMDLSHGASVSGRLVDRSGEALAGARVFSITQDEVGKPIRRGGGMIGGSDIEGLPYHQTFSTDWAEEARSDAEGLFTLDGRPPGLIHLRIEYGHELFEDLPALEIPAQGEVRLGDVQLRRGSSVRGLIFDESGERLRGGSLVLSRVGEDGSSESGSTVYSKIDGEGAFKETGLHAGRYRVGIFGNKTFEETVELGAGESREIEIRLPPAR